MEDSNSLDSCFSFDVKISARLYQIEVFLRRIYTENIDSEAELMEDLSQLFFSGMGVVAEHRRFNRVLAGEHLISS